MAVVGGVRGDGIPKADAHGGVGPGVKTQAWVGDGEDRPGDVHCVGALGDVDDTAQLGRGETLQGALDGVEGTSVGHWKSAD